MSGPVATLILTTPQGTTWQASIVTPETTMGRAPHNDIVLYCPRVSRLHAVLTIEGPFVSIRDVGSRNGTFVNGERVERQLLAHGDIIDLGDFWIRFLTVGYEEVPAETVSHLTHRGLLI